jgi:hypothetical protein
MERIKEQPLDNRSFQWFKRHGYIDPFLYLEGDADFRNEQKSDFISGKIENPSLDCPKIDIEKLKVRERKILTLKWLIGETEQNEPLKISDPEGHEALRLAYLWRINESLAGMRMLYAAKNGDSKRFRRYSEFIYGKPSSEVYSYTVDKIWDKIGEGLSSTDPDVSNAAKELAKVLPQKPHPKQQIEAPSQAAFASAKKYVREELDALVEIPTKDGKFNADEIRKLFNQIFEKLKIENKWKTVLVETQSKNVRVDQEKETVEIPTSKELSFTNLEKLIAHEPGTHTTRRAEGERSRVKLLGVGFDRYDRGEEGVATMKTQVLEEKFEDFSGLENHLAISLAYGLDNGGKKDFRGVYEIMKKYYTLTSLLSGKKREDAIRSAKNSAWNVSVRTFRGTDCVSAGNCFTKDIVYREGNIGVWKVLSNNPEEIQMFSIGKYDPANPRHVWLLKQLPINDEDLSNLEK